MCLCSWSTSSGKDAEAGQIRGNGIDMFVMARTPSTPLTCSESGRRDASSTTLQAHRCFATLRCVWPVECLLFQERTLWKPSLPLMMGSVLFSCPIVFLVSCDPSRQLRHECLLWACKVGCWFSAGMQKKRIRSLMPRADMCVRAMQKI